jgi:hypothetical protein
MSRAVARRRVGVANPTDDRLCSGEELLAMASDAGRMLRIIGDIGERGVAGSDFVEVCRRDLVT